MGLDMYLEGRSYLWTNWDDPDKDLKRDGYRVSDVTLELGYWRKHPDLHGYIVQTFAGGKDECQDIPLTAENLIQIVEAIQNRTLPHTEGFFFGSSDGSEEKASVKILLGAIKWLEGVPNLPVLKNPTPLKGSGMVIAAVDVENVKQTSESRSVVYRASW